MTIKMFFPVKDRVVYDINPLQEVICQLRFPKILRLEGLKPFEIQEALSKSYPKLVESQSINFEIKEIEGKFTSIQDTRPIYEFLSEDGAKVSVTSESIALTVKAYSRWEKFLSELTNIIEPFEEIYKPITYTRIGLRYVNLIQPSILGITDKALAELVNPLLGGILCDESIGANQRESNGNFFLSNGSDGMTARYASIQVNDERAYLIDGDFYTLAEGENLGAFHDNIGRIGQYKQDAHNFFRWAISEPLHEALRPNPI